MTDWIIILLIHTCLLTLLAISFDITAGNLGHINIATAALYGVGAYVTAILITTYHWNFFATLPISIVAGAFVGMVIGFPSLRVRGLYYLLASIGFQFLIFDLFKNASSLGIDESIKDIPHPSLLWMNFSSPKQFLALTLLVVGIVLAFTWRLTSSPFGRLMRGIRENELLVLTMGKNSNRVKLQTFAVSGAIAAMAGSLYAAHIRVVSYEAFGLDLSIKLLVIVAIGGMGYLIGPILGAMFVVTVPEVLRFSGIDAENVGPIERIIFASVLLLLVLLRPRGLSSVFESVTLSNWRTMLFKRGC